MIFWNFANWLNELARSTFDTSLRSPKIITLINIRCEWDLSETRKFPRRVYAKIAFLCAFWNRLGTLRATPCLCRNQETWFTIIDFWAYKRDQAASPFENKRSMMVQKRKVDDIKGQIFEKFSLDAEICDCARAFKSTGESYHFDLPGARIMKLSFKRITCRALAFV